MRRVSKIIPQVEITPQVERKKIIYRGFEHDVILQEYERKTGAMLDYNVRDGSFYGDLSECKETLRMLVVCVNWENYHCFAQSILPHAGNK